jgi:hypothetical protein
MNGEFETMWKGAIVAYSRVLHPALSGVDSENE